MRPASRLSVCLAAIGVAFTLVFCNYGRTEETAKAKPGIKELRQKRLAVLQQLCEIAHKQFQGGRLELPEVLAAYRQRFAIRLESAETKADRINVCLDAISHAAQLRDIAKSRQESARGTYIAVLQAQDYELEIQIAHAKAEASD